MGTGEGIRNVSSNGVFGNEVYCGDSEGFGLNPSSDEFRLCNSDEWRFINGGGPLEIRGYGGGGDMVEFGWRVGLYSKTEGGKIGMEIALQNALIVRNETSEGVVCNIPFWLARYLKGVRDGKVIYGSMYVTQLARYFGILTRSMIRALSFEPPAQIIKKKTFQEEEEEKKEGNEDGTEGSIDPFPGHETDYPPFSYSSHMPPGYDYHYDTAPNGSN
ncbi:hypothetical protein Tco_0811079 [Tanacetum coccineum]